MKKIWLFSKIFKGGPVRPSDTGLFDPYLPIKSLKPLGSDRDVFNLPDLETIDNSVPPEEGRAEKSGLLLFKLVLTLAMTVFICRLAYLQISEGGKNYALAEGNRLRDELIVAPRGLIFDKNGVQLVKNVPSFAIAYRISELPKKSERAALYEQIAKALETDASSVESRINTGIKSDSVTLVEGLDRDRALSYELRLSSFNGVEVVKLPVREYVNIASVGHLLGYVGKITAEEQKARPNLLKSAVVGKVGLEKYYDDTLQGIPGIETVEVDSQNRVIRTVGTQASQVGSSLILGLDSELQKVAAQALSDSIVKNGATSGSAVVMNVKTGDILAMVSVPDFDANVFSNSSKQVERQAVLNDALSPMMNRAISGQYPSGSTIKPIVASAGLAEKVITASTKLDTSEGKISIGQWTFPDWKTHGTTDVKQAIAESNNIFFYSVGGGYKNITGLGADKLSYYLKKFGFGSKTGIDLPGEQDGLVPTPEWKKKIKNESWYVGDTYHLAIGQGDLLVTPLQLTNAIAAIANGGILYQPRLVTKIVSNDGQDQKVVSSKVIANNVVSDDYLRVVREGMRQTVTNGSGRAMSSLPVEVAAKTGTAQFDVEKLKTHSWFTAFAPYGNPEIALSVIVEGGGEGYSVAEPVAKNIIEKYFNLPLTPIVAAKTE